MRILHVSPPVVETAPLGTRVSARFRVGCRTKDVWFRVTPGPVSPFSDPFLPVALIPAMRRGWRVAIEGAVSEPLLRGADRVQTTLTGWYPRFRRVDVACPVATPSRLVARGAVACFFSGGVDSSYTLRRHRDEITDLIFVHGFDIPLWQRRSRERAAASVRDFANREGLRLVEVETNLRQFGEPYVGWVDAGFGPALGAVALLLAPRFERIYIPASVGAGELEPMGSHPDLDPRWSDGRTEVVHDGLEATRFDKILAIADWPAVHTHLRVCYADRPGKPNCGRCIKCLWTMMILRAAGCLERFETFDAPLDLRLLRRHTPVHTYHRQRFVKSIALLEARGTDDELLAVMRDMLNADGRVPRRERITRLMTSARLHLSHLVPCGG